jgi:DNA-binding NtrC family response regulator
MKNILIVDDEDLIRHSLSAALRGNDTLVKTASCGKDALVEIRRDFYNLCFLDIRLPDACGLELMKTVHEASPATKIIIMTADEIDEDLMGDIQKNSWCFLPKPFELEDVRLLVNRA